MHSFLDKDGIRRSSHLLKDCRIFQAQIQEYIEMQRAVAAAPNHPQPVPGAVAHGAPPPPPLNIGQPPIAPQAANPPRQNVEAYPTTIGSMQMIQKGRPSNRSQKLITRQVNLAQTAPPATPEYLDCSEVPITFDREDHPPLIPRPGHSALVLDAQIGGFHMSRVFMDGGSGVNLIFAKTLRKMGISLENLAATETSFHGIEPGQPIIPYGKIPLDVVFGTPDNFRRETIVFDVVDLPSQYHAILGRPAYARFLCVAHYTYLKLKIPGRDGRVITVDGNFTKSDKCDKDFHKMAESFGMHEERLELKETTDLSLLPSVKRNAPGQEFNNDSSTKPVQVHPTDPSKTALVSTTLDSA